MVRRGGEEGTCGGVVVGGRATRRRMAEVEDDGGLLHR